jgi:hypothetical protein
MTNDAVLLAVQQVETIVRAAVAMPEARDQLHPLATGRISVLRDLAMLLGERADEFATRLDGTGPHAEFDEIVRSYWTSPDDADTEPDA